MDPEGTPFECAVRVGCSHEVDPTTGRCVANALDCTYTKHTVEGSGKPVYQLAVYQLAESSESAGSWLPALVFPLFVTGCVFAPYLVLAVCASLFAESNMWVTFAFITAMLGAMDQEHASVLATVSFKCENEDSSTEIQGSSLEKG